MTTFARKGSSSIASHSKGVLRKSVSSPAANAVVSDVHELVQRLESRQHGTVDPLQPQSSSSPRQYVVHEDLVVDIRGLPAPDDILSPAAASSSSQRATPLSGAWGARTPIPDGPVYSALRQEMVKVRLDDAAGHRSPSSPLSRDGSPRSSHAGPSATPEKKMQAMESSLDEARTSNRLLSRALSAVQQRLKQTEMEREQLRRERDYFRQLALRFPFTLSVDAVARRRFQSYSTSDN